MEPKIEATESRYRSGICGQKSRDIGFGFADIHRLMATAPPPETGSSFTALLELPATQVVELLVNSPEAANEEFPAKPNIAHLPSPQMFPTNITLIDHASKFAALTPAHNSPENYSLLSVSSTKKLDVVKQEQMDSDSNPNGSSPAVSEQNLKSCKRKEREKKVKESNKKSRRVVPNEDGGEKLPYVHVRARRGQATDSHSLAERARREKINARMKLLQDLVPGCNKISGTAMVLDEIINHVQALQSQVEFLSMRLAAVNPRLDFNPDTLLAVESASPMANSYPGGMFTPSIWPEEQINGNGQQNQQLWHFNGLQQVWGGEGNNSNFVTLENSLLSYDT